MTIQVAETADAHKIAKTFSKAFYPVPFEKYLTHNKPIDVNFFKYQKRVQEFINAGALILEANDHQAIAIFVPPDITYPRYDPSITDERAIEVSSKFTKLDGIANDSMSGRPKWSLAFLAKDPDATQKGLVSSLLRPILDQIKEENGFAVLKAIDKRPKEIYEHYGFRVLGSATFGEGVVNANGEDDEDGLGIEAWSLVYNA